MDVFSKALTTAAKAHGSQLQKYTNQPYIVHPIAVAATVREVLDQSLGFSKMQIEEVCAAAVMHDVLEDTTYTEQEMREEHGNTITDLVLQVTDVSRPTDGNRAIRKEIDRKHLARASYFGKTIKLADLIDNTSSIVKYDPNFAVKYLREKELLLRLLCNGHPVLLARANEFLANGLKAIGR